MPFDLDSAQVHNWEVGVEILQQMHEAFILQVGCA